MQRRKLEANVGRSDNSRSSDAGTTRSDHGDDDDDNDTRDSHKVSQQRQLPLKSVRVGIAVLVVTCLMFVWSIIFLRPIQPNSQEEELSRRSPSSPSSTLLPAPTNRAQQRQSSATELHLPQEETVQQQQQQQQQQPRPTKDDKPPEYHIVFSTGCSIYQDWQSYLFFHGAMEKNQSGIITRIVSGCNPQDEAKLRQVFEEQIIPMSDRFRIHFTPDYSRPRPGMMQYVYFNKPFGMRHWLENALGFPHEPLNENAIVILLDPDQLILRPFTDNNFSNTVWHRVPRGMVPRTRIEQGRPMGQLYGFDLQWIKHVNMSFLIAPNETSPVAQLNRDDARAGYVVGPPYIATARDMYHIVLKWCDFALPVHDQYPHLLAEMFAYCLAAAHLGLAHQTAVSFMVSDVGGGGGEGWSYVDALGPEEVCHAKSPEQLPNVLHYCQVYALGNYFFGKRRLPKNFLSCESPLLDEIPDNFMADHAMYPQARIENLSTKHALRHKFMLCHLLGALNRAAVYYKNRHCAQSSSTTNLARTLKLLT